MSKPKPTRRELLALLVSLIGATTYLQALRARPARVMTWGGMRPDPWQAALLQSHAPRTLLLCCRQAGKSTTTAALSLRTALLEPGSLILLLSPSLRQSGELFRKITALYQDLGRPVPVLRETALTLELQNGSRIVSLPESEETIRGYSGVRLLVIDEASRVSDALYYSVRPMLAVSHGRLIALSTPFGRRGWFHEEWKGNGPWEKVKITASQCPRISKAFLEEERAALGKRWFDQEYGCSFEETVGALFSQEDIDAALSGDGETLDLA